jgi:antitoxin component YwqK of YwqJK toxin-antitoxin module
MKPKLKETFYPNGKVWQQEWYLNGERHNEEGPANIWFYDSGKVSFQSWYLNGNIHNEEGPARIRYYEDGKVDYQAWYLNGKYLSKEDFTSLDMIRRMDAFEFFSAIEIARFKI